MAFARPRGGGLDTSDEERAKTIDDYLTRSAAFGFAGGVLVARHGNALLCKGYGLADREREIPWTAETAFDIGSLTKAFTAAAVLELATDGKLATGDPISKYLDAVPEDKTGITIHHLLTHTSGLVRDAGNRGVQTTRDEMVKLVLATTLQSKPGEKYSYSNAGYVLLAAIVERASGEDYRAFMRHRVFDPLGMTKTGFYGDASRWSRDAVAHAYFETAEEGCPLDWPQTWSATGNGHVISTLGDFLRWDVGLRGKELLSDDAKRAMWTPHAPAGDRFGYGYGWLVAKAGGPKLQFHNGYYRSFGTEFRRYPDEELAILVATNEGFAGGTAQQVAITDPVATIALGRPHELPPAVVPLDPKLAARICGTYKLPSGAYFEFRLRHGALVVEADGQEAFDALSGGDAARRAEYAKLDERTAALNAAIQKGDRGIAAGALDAAGNDLFARMFDAGWSGLAKQFGPFRGFDVLGTAPCPFANGCARTYVRLRFEREPVLVSFGYRGESFFDLSTWEKVPNPSAIPVAPLSPTLLATWDLSTAKGTTIELGVEGDAITEIRFAERDPAVTAKRSN
jgi:CubicO group peptidase (beta-lactamase class C family)